MAEIKWNDGDGSRGRGPWLLLIKGEEITRFAGETIPGLVVVRGSDYEKNGKWSNTTYRLEIATGVRTISGRDGWETGRFVEGLRSATGCGKPVDTWGDVAMALGVSVPSAMQFLRSWRPKAAERLDEVDAQLEALDLAAEAAGVVADNETVVVSFGGPSRRAMAEGFWESPKAIIQYPGAQLVLLDSSKGWVEGNIGIDGAVGTVTAVVHASGYHGGYVSVTIVVAGKSTPEPSRRMPVDAFDGFDSSPSAFVPVVEKSAAVPATVPVVVAPVMPKEPETPVDLKKVDLSGLFSGSARRK